MDECQRLCTPQVVIAAVGICVRIVWHTHAHTHTQEMASTTRYLIQCILAAARFDDVSTASVSANKRRHRVCLCTYYTGARKSRRAWICSRVSVAGWPTKYRRIMTLDSWKIAVSPLWWSHCYNVYTIYNMYYCCIRKDP